MDEGLIKRITELNESSDQLSINVNDGMYIVYSCKLL